MPSYDINRVVHAITEDLTDSVCQFCQGTGTVKIHSNASDPFYNLIPCRHCNMSESSTK